MLVSLEISAKMTRYSFNSGSGIDQYGSYNGTFYGNSSNNDELTIGYNTNDYFEIPSEVLNDKLVFTLQFKVKFTDLNVTGDVPTNSLFAGSTVDNNSTFAFSYQKSLNKWMFLNGTDLLQFEDNSIVTNKWYCVTLKRNKDGLVTLYVDGVQNISSFVSLPKLEMTSLIVGQETDCFGGCFDETQSANASFDDIELYDSLVSLSIIQKFCGEKCLMSNFYDFNAGSGNDKIGSLNGTFQGNASVDNQLMVSNNVNDYFVLPADVLNNQMVFTIQFNIKFTELNLNGIYPTNSILAGSTSDVASTFAFSYQKDQNSWMFLNNSDVLPFFDNSIVAGKWYSVVLTRNNDGHVDLFVNGLKNSQTLSSSSSLLMTNLVVGQETDCDGGCFEAHQSANAIIDNLGFSKCSNIDMIDGISLGINEKIGNVDYNLFPNPVHDYVTLTGKDRILNIEISSVNSVFFKQIDGGNNFSIGFNTNELSSGIYIAKVNTLSGSYFVKFAKN